MKNHKPFVGNDNKKFLIMTIGSMGLYLIYWNLANWVRQKNYNGEKIMPKFRTVFMFFFAPSFFTRVKKEQSRMGVGDDFPVIVSVLIYYVEWFVSIVPITMDATVQEDPGLEFLGYFLFIMALQVMAFLPSQLAIKRIFVATNRELESKFSGLDISLLLFGSLWWLAVLALSFLQ